MEQVACGTWYQAKTDYGPLAYARLLPGRKAPADW